MPIEFVSRHSRHPRPAKLAESSNDMPNLQAQLYGDTAVFIRCPATDAAAIAQACRQQFPAAIDAWCGDSSVLVQFGEPIKDAARLLRQIPHLETQPPRCGITESSRCRSPTKVRILQRSRRNPACRLRLWSPATSAATIASPSLGSHPDLPT